MNTASTIVEQHLVERAMSTLLSLDSAANNQAVKAKLGLLSAKLSQGQLHLAVLGQMKRGKSSLINALLRAPVLPTGVLPVTAIITEIRYGPTAKATVIYATGDLREEVPLSALAEYITEIGNPGNKKQVASVEVAYPSPFLEDGIVLIDTPGIGSTFAHNTATTERYLSQVDAGIVVLSVDPPLTEVEASFIKSLRQDIPKLFFIMNKIDVTSPDEVRTSINFLERELERLSLPTPEIYPLSTRQAGHASLECTSGLATFESRLRNFLSDEKRQVLSRSIALDVAEIVRTLRFAASVGTRAAAMNPEELRQKRPELDRLLEQTATEIQEMHALIRQRTADILTTVEGELSAHASNQVPAVQEHLRVFQRQNPLLTGRPLGTQLEAFLEKEIESIFEQWHVQEDERIQVHLNATSNRFLELANGILDRLQAVAATLFQVPVEHLAISCPLRVESHLRYRVERVFYSLDSFLLLLPPFLLRPIVFRRLNNNIPLLLDMNAGRMRYDYLERLQQTIAEFQADLTRAIAVVVDSLKDALHMPPGRAGGQAATIKILDDVLKDCDYVLADPVAHGN